MWCYAASLLCGVSKCCCDTSVCAAAARVCAYYPITTCNVSQLEQHQQNKTQKQRKIRKKQTLLPNNVTMQELVQTTTGFMHRGWKAMVVTITVDFL